MEEPLFRLGGAVVALGKPQRNNTSRYARVSDAKPLSNPATWEDADPHDLWKTIVAITDAGDGVTLARTRDGGAISLVILSGDERIRKYARGEEDTATLLREIRESLEATD